MSQSTDTSMTKQSKALNVDSVSVDCDNGLSISELRRKYEVGWKTITDFLKENNLTINNTALKNRRSAQLSEAAKARWADKEYVSKQSAAHRSTEYKAKQSAALKGRWMDINYREVATSANRDRWADPDSKIKASKTTLTMWQDNEFRDRQSSGLKAWRDKHDTKLKLALSRSATPRTLTKPHSKVVELLRILGVEVVSEYPLGPYCFDIFIPAHNLLIEVQGDYWHSLKENVANDKAKSTYIKEYFPDLKLKYVWEHECLTEGSVLAKLKYWMELEKIDQVEYGLGQIEVMLVDDTKLADTFLYNWHYQHHGRHGLDIGGYVNGELAVLARFTPPSRKEVATSIFYAQKEILELARLVVHPRYQKKNLLSWFLARCEPLIRSSRPEIKCLVSFADSTYNHTGAVYKASNWTLNKVVDANYWYVDAQGWVMHKKTLWNHSKKMKMSEPDYAAKNGYTKVWGKEKYKFVKELT